MNTRSIKTKLYLLSSSIILSLGWAPAMASAVATTPTTTPDSSTTTQTQTQRLDNIISKGNLEIERRLTNLSKLSSIISSSTKLTPSDETLLSNEVSTTISGLNTLKTQLDSETTLAAAQTDVANIVTEYRVYALVDPKIHLVKVADDQQVLETKLSTLSGKLQTRINTDKANGQDVTTLSSELSSMNGSIQAAQAISSSIESSVINLQPTDYDSNHSVLAGDNSQLLTARADIVSAYTDAKNIISSLEATMSSTPNSPSTTK